MQATVRSFDPATGSGTVFLDDGTVLEFSGAVFAASGLRLLRPGQRVAVHREPGGPVTALTLATFPLPRPKPTGPKPPKAQGRAVAPPAR